jgi:hypothetical protein
MTTLDLLVTTFVEAAPMVLRAIDAAWCAYDEVKPAGKLLAWARAIDTFRDYIESH